MSILHLDADAFFASCEQAVHPDLRGQPVATGGERGIIAAASYEAKAKGVGRGVGLWEARQMCPGLVVLPSDYETYSHYSLRLYDILRRFSPVIEEYSIDEAFVDLRGLGRRHHGTFQEIAERIQATVAQELKLGVSIGIAPTKVLAKIASKHRKPQGITVIERHEVESYLRELPTVKLWGIGERTAHHLQNLNVYTALEFARCSEEFIRKHFTKVQVEIWNEVNGRSAYIVCPTPRPERQSIGKFKTFSPSSANKSFILSQLIRNIENACIKARGYSLIARRLLLFLRTQEYRHSAVEVRLDRATAFPTDLIDVAREGFEAMYDSLAIYRATGCCLTHLLPESSGQLSLFDGPRPERLSQVYQSVDAMDKRFGKHVVRIGGSLPSQAAIRERERIRAEQSKRKNHHDRSRQPWRKTNLLPGETERQRLGVIMLDLDV